MHTNKQSHTPLTTFILQKTDFFGHVLSVFFPLISVVLFLLLSLLQYPFPPCLSIHWGLLTPSPPLKFLPPFSPSRIVKLPHLPLYLFYILTACHYLSYSFFLPATSSLQLPPSPPLHPFPLPDGLFVFSLPRASRVESRPHVGGSNHVQTPPRRHNTHLGPISRCCYWCVDDDATTTTTTITTTDSGTHAGRKEGQTGSADKQSR